MNFLAEAAAPAASAPGLSINFFWIIVVALNFIFFLALIWIMAFKPIANILSTRVATIAAGLALAEQARKDRDSAAAERAEVIAEARRESQALVAAAQKSAQELRAADIAATREELSRIREKATADIAAERDRALADLQAKVADLALTAAGRLVGEEMNDARQRRLVEGYLAQGGSAKGQKN
ncbi:MAG TPA: F0F1 ATP synthase subunit B [Candidatus Limnocylindrales bacterium]